MTTLSIDLHLLLITSLFIFGLNFATEYEECEDHIFNDSSATFRYQKIIKNKSLLWFLRFWSVRAIGEFWSKTLFTCTSCMSSVWGTLSYILFAHNQSVVSWAVTVMALAGLNRILKAFAP